jgi:hypothetical protein
VGGRHGEAVRFWTSCPLLELSRAISATPKGVALSIPKGTLFGSPIKRARRTKAEIALVESAIYNTLERDHPVTIRTFSGSLVAAEKCIRLADMPVGWGRVAQLVPFRAAVVPGVAPSGLVGPYRRLPPPDVVGRLAAPRLAGVFLIAGELRVPLAGRNPGAERVGAGRPRPVQQDGEAENGKPDDGEQSHPVSRLTSSPKTTAVETRGN